MSSLCAMPQFRRNSVIGLRSLNPYGMARYLVLTVGLFFVVLTVLDWVFTSGIRAGQLGVSSSDRTIPQAIRGAILFMMLCYIAFTDWDPGAYHFLPGRALFALAAYMLISTFFEGAELTWRLFSFVKSLTWIVAAIAFYRLTLGGYLSAKSIGRFVAVVVLIACALTFAFCLTEGRRIGQNADASLLLWCMPLLLLRRPQLRAAGLAGLASLAVAVTVKRGAILALMMGALVYIISSMRVAPPTRRRLRHLLVPVLLLIVVAGAIAWQWGNIQYRVNRDLDKGTLGSGRSWFYRVIIAEWYSADLPTLVLGRGFFTVPQTLGEHGMVIYAHSDWLEILNDMGVIGVALFAYLHFQILSLVLRLVHQRSAVAPAMAMGYCIFAMRTVYSQCVVGHTETVYFALLLGYSAAVAVSHSGYGLSGTSLPRVCGAPPWNRLRHRNAQM